ncbi:hypothetical protein AOQ84DRAFT_312895 [Glonium stellatum]|uniref:mRNA decay factor PAT1 domain-containing protein n=1 Tax=Glonium stellatum TaxID=574774 RepID=A0A8E2JWG1_9PEZI|nr:hypothetical protein AOQ84DRAFT_312895 [Glonium stellatum]
MSFFGFDTTLPRDRGHQTNAPGFGQVPDAFAGLSGSGALKDDDDALDFEDTYDGLADQLDETNDAFNDDTFGDEPASQQNIGKDYDFAGQTSKITEALDQEYARYRAGRPPSHSSPAKTSSKPARHGYESYTEPSRIPQLQANANIWGITPKQPAHTQVEQASLRQESQNVPAAPARKMMSLEEVEAMMRAQSKKPAPAPPAPVLQPDQRPMVHSHPQQPLPPQRHDQYAGPSQQVGLNGPPQILQRPHQPAAQRPTSASRPQVHAELPGHTIQTPVPQHPTILQRQRPAQPEAVTQPHRHTHPQPTTQRPPSQPSQPRQILQNPNRLSGHGQPISQPAQRQAELQRTPPAGPSHSRGQSFQGPVVTHPEQLLHLSEEDRAAFLMEDAKRAKRNHKIHMLSKDNGLMTPQDKNFITRIQLQQLMAATGGVDEQGPEAALAEDFYYQVYTQIRGAPRQNPHQPASQFAQTYLFQTGGRYGLGGRRHNRGGDNHMQRMEQQVQRAVEAAKAKPKGKQLVIEGSLGKISFSNAKTPKPMLNIKRPESREGHHGTGRRPSRVHPHDPSILDRKSTLRNIERVYSTLMQMEDHERHVPPPVTEESDPATIQKHMEWQQKFQTLHHNLWQDLKIMEPINPNSLTPHPFIAILSHPKGKKAIPRIFRQIDEQQRITVLTMIVVHLDSLSVVAHAVPSPDESTLPRPVREEVELFSHAVMPSLFAHISESPLNIVIGLLGLILDRTNLAVAARTKIGMSLLTMLISRAELLKQSTPEMNLMDWEQWTLLYNQLFDSVEPVLPLVFPGSVNDADDVYVWQFLAAMGVGASPEQQQRLVLGVKDRVMETVAVSKALPAEMASVRLGHVNLFMRAIGLDVELLG